MEKKLSLNTFDVTATALLAALICVLGPLSLPIGPVPIALGSLAVYLAAYIGGKYRGTMAVLLYLLIGLVGVPVFSNFSGGIAKLIGPTGGYLIGYIPMALLIGAASDKGRRVIVLIAMIAGTLILYALGTAWLAVSAHMGFIQALSAGVIPFIPGDLLKIAAAAIISPKIKSRIVPLAKM